MHYEFWLTDLFRKSQQEGGSSFAAQAIWFARRPVGSKLVIEMFHRSELHNEFIKYANSNNEMDRSKEWSLLDQLLIIFLGAREIEKLPRKVLRNLAGQMETSGTDNFWEPRNILRVQEYAPKFMDYSIFLPSEA